MNWVTRRANWLWLQARDWVELFALPGLALLMPWPWAFGLFRLLVWLPWLYREDAVVALENARKRGYVADDAAWLRRRKLITLVDHADHYLARTRSHRWMARYVKVEGAWPPANTPALLCTFHWGAGMWSLRHARLSGMQAHSLVAPMNAEHFRGRPVLYAYVKARVQTVSNELGVDALDVASSMRPVLQALRSKQQVLAAIDVPADTAEASMQLRMLDERIQIPRALMRVAAEKAIPVTLFTVGLNVETGMRQLKLVQLPVEDDLERLLQGVLDHLDQKIRMEPWAWHFWAQADRFFVQK